MILSVDTPTFIEWIAILHDDAKRAEHLAAVLTTQLRDFPLMVSPSVQISFEEFTKAKEWLAEAIAGSTKHHQLEQQVSLGHLTMMPPPDRTRWQSLISADPKYALRIYAAF